VYEVSPLWRALEGRRRDALLHGLLGAFRTSALLDRTSRSARREEFAEVARVSGTHENKWLDYDRREFLTWNVVILRGPRAAADQGREGVLGRADVLLPRG
jgi:hypothetical protein